MRRLPTRVVLAVVALGLLLVVVLDTKYISAEDAAELNPAEFNAETYARDEFPKVVERIGRDATDVAELAPAIDRDLAAAGKRYGHGLGSGNYSFAIEATGTVKQVDKDFVLIDVPDVPQGTEVRIPLGLALNGTPVRDATGTIAFGDFPGQTDYQSVANQFKLLMQRQILAELEPKQLEGERITVQGGWNTGGPPGSYIIQPTRIEVGT